MLKILGKTFNLIPKQKNFFANAVCTMGATYYAITGFFSVPTNIHNDPDPDRASGSFLFFSRHKKHISNADHKTTHPEAVVKDINEKNYDHPFNPNQRA